MDSGLLDKRDSEKCKRVETREGVDAREAVDMPEPSAARGGGKSGPDEETTQAGLVEAHFAHRGRGIEFDMEVAWVRRHVPAGRGPIVDIGCGIGGLFDTLGRKRAVGVDLNAAGLTGTRERFTSVPLLCGKAEALPFADGVLDAITSQHVVEHLADYGGACREWYRALRPGGVLLTLTPNARFCDPSVYHDDTHVHIFSPDDLPRVLGEAGFDVIDLRTLGLPWFRRHDRIPGGWRLRRFVIQHARRLSTFEPVRWKGQTLCCAARKPV